MKDLRTEDLIQKQVCFTIQQLIQLKILK